jgi:dTDP-4-dehydrorhamnose reductase
MIKILITGSNGQMGTDAVATLQGAHEVLALSRTDLDITDLAGIEKIVDRFRPAFILNCAAYTRVDDCEGQRELAFAVNVTGPRNLAASVQKYGGKLIHISTDYVFDGLRAVPKPYVEDDEPGPISYYGQTKLESEQAIQGLTDRYMILRTAWVYGATGRNFPKTILRLALKDSRKEIRVVDDQVGSLTWSHRLIQQIARLIEVDGQGIYHATAKGFGSWYEVAIAFLRFMGVPHNVVPCTTDQYPTRAVRPKNSILENRRLKAEGINVMRPWKEDLEEFARRFRERLLQEATET